MPYRPCPTCRHGCPCTADGPGCPHLGCPAPGGTGDCPGLAYENAREEAIARARRPRPVQPRLFTYA